MLQEKPPPLILIEEGVTDTVNVQVEEFPALSVACAVTLVSPAPKVDSEETLYDIVGAGSVSSTAVAGE